MDAGRNGRHRRKRPGTVVHEGLSPGRRAAAHRADSSQPLICHCCELLCKGSGVWVQVVKLIEENIGHRFVPPVITALRNGLIQIDILLRPVIKILFAHQDPVFAILIAFVDADQRCADDRRQDVDSLGKILPRRAHDGLEAEARVLRVIDGALVLPDQGEILSCAIQVEHQRIVAHRNPLPVAHLIRRGEVWHHLDAGNCDLL